ncbi:MAG TPA: metallophosphoesterase [Pyrinomonadaceae bacterium]|nr:metallophosphoesterase [Pyrinomonadaceae bacterium]
MKVGILHLSDIHIESAKDWIIDKGEKISQAVLGTWEELGTLFVVVTGDIANKGLVEHYDQAYEFFSVIRNYFQEQSGVKVCFIIAPGNHDCDFANGKLDAKARQSFINTVVSNPKNIARGDSIFEGCLSVLENFFAFANKIEPALPYPTSPDVFYQINIRIEPHTFYFNIFNTAWLSQKEEDQGGLVFPIHLINCDPDELSKGALSISLFHHPDNWLDSNNARDFRRVTEQTSDIILTGHEHHREVFYKLNPETGVGNQVIKAPALQERIRTQSSSFNLVIVDLENKRQKLSEFKWKGTEYAVEKENDWQDFMRNRFLQKRSFYLLPEFENYLNSLGSLNANSRNRTIQLEDFFMTPRLIEMSLKDVIRGKKYSKRIEADKFFEFIFEKKTVLIFGDTWQGKTTVAKKVFKEFYENQLATLLVDGSKFNSPSREHFKRILREEFPYQYEGGLWNTFLQLPKEKRALIIDNFGQSQHLNQNSLHKLLQVANKQFEFVVVFAHTDLHIQQFSSTDTVQPELSDYVHCQMLPLDPTQRTQLIRRWVKAEADVGTEEAALIRHENQLRTLIREAINNGLITSTPFYIFGALQLIESLKTNPNAQFGSIGYIYEGVITSRLYELGKTAVEIDRTFLVISLVAYWLYINDADEIEEHDLNEVIEKYNSEYRSNIDVQRFLKELRKAQILSRQVTGTWKFIGSHLRDFFVAKYLARALGDDGSPQQKEANSTIETMVETLVYEPHTRILLFLVYEAKSNTRLINYILNEARLVFGNSQPTDLEADVKFLNDVEQAMLDENLLQSADPRKNQDLQDQAQKTGEEDADTSAIQDYKKKLVKYSDDLDHFTKTAFALKMIELVGQLVKSFSGTIRAELKEKLIQECVDVGLRLLFAIFKTNEKHLQELGAILRHLIREYNDRLQSKNLLSRLDELLLLLHNDMAYGVIKRVSQSIGHVDLRGSFTDVFKEREQVSYQLVEAAIRLDNYAPSAKSLMEFGKELLDSKNKFAYNILRRLVADYVNYSEIDRKERQKLVEKFQLAGGAEYLLNTAKSDRTYHPRPRKTGKLSPPKKN